MGLKSLAHCGGCAAKAPATMVSQLLAALRVSGQPETADILVGLDPPDDAAVQRIDDSTAVVTTIDAFPPIVDDPGDFGAIAAANAVSDVYAMGGRVLSALVLLAFPRDTDPRIPAAILTAARDVIAGCGGQVVGGHTVHAAEPLVGLSVSGLVHPGEIWRKRGAQPGDALVLSKPLGTGILLTAGDPLPLGAALESMKRTNRQAAALLRRPHAVTDVSGYGLLGHIAEMLRGGGAAFRLRTSAIPLLPGSRDAAARGVRTSAAESNARAVDDVLFVAEGVGETDLALLCDPQTSGGLLAAVDPASLSALTTAGFIPIGSVHDGPARLIIEP